MRSVDLIARKRDGGELDAGEIAALVDGFMGGDVSDAQMAALLMAGVLNGFSAAEAQALTDALVASGETLDLSRLTGPTIDKHSTGGVGDGTTLLVGPLLASAGAQMVKLSGRGLGHTGGTLDKLESIPGVRVDLDPAGMVEIAQDVGCVVAAQTDRLVPADRELYALRDITATVPSPALIASSVISKKLASGAGTIVLDVKVGDGAFMDRLEDAEQLADLCVNLARAAGRRCGALVTDMDQPLGRGVGNALEVAEAVTLLQNEPAGRLADVALELATFALQEARANAGGMADPSRIRAELEEKWRAGSTLERLRAMVVAQGGPPDLCDDPWKILPEAAVVRDVVATRGGRVGRLPARAVGELASMLGAGRARKGDDVDPAVGIEVGIEVGDDVEPGQVIARVHARDADAAEHATQRFQALVGFAEDTPRRDPVLRRIAPG